MLTAHLFLTCSNAVFYFSLICHVSISRFLIWFHVKIVYVENCWFQYFLSCPEYVWDSAAYSYPISKRAENYSNHFFENILKQYVLTFFESSIKTFFVCVCVVEKFAFWDSNCRVSDSGFAVYFCVFVYVQYRKLKYNILTIMCESKNNNIWICLQWLAWKSKLFIPQNPTALIIYLLGSVFQNHIFDHICIWFSLYSHSLYHWIQWFSLVLWASFWSLACYNLIKFLSRKEKTIMRYTK